MLQIFILNAYSKFTFITSSALPVLSWNSKFSLPPQSDFAFLNPISNLWNNFALPNNLTLSKHLHAAATLLILWFFRGIMLNTMQSWESDQSSKQESEGLMKRTWLQLVRNCTLQNVCPNFKTEKRGPELSSEEDHERQRGVLKKVWRQELKMNEETWVWLGQYSNSIIQVENS